MASTSNLFAALVGLTETPESATDGTDEDGFIEIRCLCRWHVFFRSQLHAATLRARGQVVYMFGGISVDLTIIS